MNRMFLVCIRRVQMHSTNKMILLTLVLYSCLLGLSQCHVNVALNKPAHQQFPFKSNYSIGDASNAVDGQKSNLTKNSGHCVLSADTETATLWVNLTSIHNIENVTIYFMTDNKQYVSSFRNQSSFLGFSVYVSNTTDRLQGTLCYKDTNFTLYTIPAVFTAVCSVHGQYVIYYNERLSKKAFPENYCRSTNNNVCEIEVYGCPATGCYGSNNSLPCPHVNCQHCHKETGTCQVCKPGYKGQQCELECETGKYGVKCSKSCANCLNQSQCHNVDGSCYEGCSAGYKGILCTEQCEQPLYGVNCSQNCSTNCSSQACDHKTGECIDPLKIGAGFGNPYYLFAVAIIAIIVVLRYRYEKRKRYNNKQDKRNRIKIRKHEKSAECLLESVLEEFEDHESISISAKPTRKQGNKFEKKYEDGDIDIDEQIHMENPYGDIYLNTRSIKDISISNLWNVIIENSKNENNGFKKEYATLLYGERHSCEIGKHPENIPKNRFKTTLPYDHSRIVLENQASDYINANFIDGLRQKDEYIATQGPKPSTVDDFWLMIWQENVVQIVMLTNLKEGPRKKCAKYWPDLDADKDCDVFIIDTLEEKQYANYVIRKILMTNKKENEKRTITQYHYITWPDHGVPDPLCLLLFHNHVTRTKTSTHKGPTLVHCSAGIGRTGTYIAIDALHKEVQQENKINIAEYVKKMREKRMNMVQTYKSWKRRGKLSWMPLRCLHCPRLILLDY